MAKAGRFEIQVDGPYPVWLRIMVDGKQVASIPHQEASDLVYVAQKAEQEARQKLPERDRGEML